LDCAVRTHPYSVKHSTTSGGPYTVIAPPPILTGSSYTDTHAAPVPTIMSSAPSTPAAKPRFRASLCDDYSAPTTTSLVSSANPSVYGKSVTFTARFHPATSGTPTGTITFKDGAATLATVALTGTSASFTQRNLRQRSPTPSSPTYNGDTHFAASNSPILTESITKAGTSIALVLSPYASRYGQAVALYAAVKSATSGTPTGTVTFRMALPVSKTGPLSLARPKSRPGPNVGTHSLTASTTAV